MYDKEECISSLLQKRIGKVSLCEKDFIAKLKKIPRSGKMVRIDKFGLNLPKRSVYDHVLSLAYNADIIFEDLKIVVNKDLFSQFIIYHDMAESIIGDAPDCTIQGLAGTTFMTRESKNVNEKIANHFIEKMLPNELKEEFCNSIKMLEENKDEIVKQFLFIDKVDPIIAVWKYIRQFRDQINIDIFIEAMSDFFINPHVINYSINKQTKYLIEFLQNKNNAIEYYRSGLANELTAKLIGNNLIML